MTEHDNKVTAFNFAFIYIFKVGNHIFSILPSMPFVIHTSLLTLLTDRLTIFFFVN